MNATEEAPTVTAEQVVDDSPVREVDVVNTAARNVVYKAVEDLLALRETLNSVPQDQSGELIIKGLDIDSLFAVLEPLHAKI